MIINYDATSAGSVLPGDSFSFVHSCGGIERLLLVGAALGGNSYDGITGITYGGSALTRGTTVAAGGNRAYLYYLINPPAGANTVTVTAASVDYWRAIAVSYKGLQQSSNPETFSTAASASGTAITTASTTVANNCWCVSFVTNDGGLAFTAGTNVNTVRNNITSVSYLGDTNQSFAAGATVSMGWTCGGTQGISAIQASLVPSTAVVGGIFTGEI